MEIDEEHPQTCVKENLSDYDMVESYEQPQQPITYYGLAVGAETQQQQPELSYGSAVGAEQIHPGRSTIKRKPSISKKKLLLNFNPEVECHERKEARNLRRRSEELVRAEQRSEKLMKEWEDLELLAREMQQNSSK